MTNDDGRIRDLEQRLDTMRRRQRGTLAVTALSGLLTVAIGSVLAYRIATDDPGRPLRIGNVTILRDGITLGEVHIDDHGVTIGGGQNELYISSRVIEIRSKRDPLGKGSMVLNSDSLFLSSSKASINLSTIGDTAQVYLHAKQDKSDTRGPMISLSTDPANAQVYLRVQQDKSGTEGDVTLRTSARNAQVETRVDVDHDNSPAALLKADLDGAGVFDVSMHRKK